MITKYVSERHGENYMKEQKLKLTYVEIDKLVESFDKEVYNDIKWKFVTEEEMENLLKTS
ncbi:hypothetical protein AB3M96_16720 [Fredinandcohnia sp. 179-A 10B2 NHS]